MGGIHINLRDASVSINNKNSAHAFYEPPETSNSPDTVFLSPEAFKALGIDLKIGRPQILESALLEHKDAHFIRAHQCTAHFKDSCNKDLPTDQRILHANKVLTLMSDEQKQVPHYQALAMNARLNLEDILRENVMDRPRPLASKSSNPFFSR